MWSGSKTLNVTVANTSISGNTSFRQGGDMLMLRQITKQTQAQM